MSIEKDRLFGPNPHNLKCSDGGYNNTIAKKACMPDTRTCGQMLANSNELNENKMSTSNINKNKRVSRSVQRTLGIFSFPLILTERVTDSSSTLYRIGKVRKYMLR